jgi:hypothetical protein
MGLFFLAGAEMNWATSFSHWVLWAFSSPFVNKSKKKKKKKTKCDRELPSGDLTYSAHGSSAGRGFSQKNKTSIF